MKNLTYQQLVNIQQAEFPNSVLVSWSEFKKLHKLDLKALETIRYYEETNPQAVCYYLKAGDNTGHYNGIRYGDAEDYSPFLHIDPKCLYN